MSASNGTRALMIQGTASGVGKSTLVAGLCRVMHRRGVRVAPFKPQNMSLNSAVSADGGEIGRAQALQAQAAGIEPSSDMNPVLLKPLGEARAQVILQGRAIGVLEAAAYQADKHRAREAVLASYARLAKQYELIFIEGAGSPAEINLRAHDIANMGFAEAIDCPVVLVADIEHGGVFAQLVGTLALLSKSEQARVMGFVINRFRGDLSLLQPGLAWLEQRTGKTVFGVLPYLSELHLDAEDAINPGPFHGVGSSVYTESAVRSSALHVLIPRLPRISNHTDFEPLQQHPQVELRYARDATGAGAADLVILPGSKCVRDDLAWLRERGWSAYLQHHLRYGGRLIGVCGGFQMLGQTIADPDGVEGLPGQSAGFGWLELHTVLKPHKQLRQVRGELLFERAVVRGYEIHAGESHGAALQRPSLRLDEGRPEGALSADSQILGTHVHGLFEEPTACAALLRWAGLAWPVPIDHAARREGMLEQLADAIEQSIDLPRLLPA